MEPHLHVGLNVCKQNGKGADVHRTDRVRVGVQRTSSE